MSLTALLNRVVAIVPMNVVTTDGYNNQHRGPGPEVPGIRTRRQQVAADEDIADRDQQARTYRYFFEASVAITGRDRIHDGPDILEVIGEPDRVDGMADTHHLEVTARIVSG